MQMIRPSNPAFHQALTEDPDFLLPKRTFIPVSCFRCHRPEPLKHLVVPTDNPCYVCISCISPACVQAAQRGVLRFIRETGESINILDSWAITYPVNIRRTNGKVESDWMIKGFFFNDEAAIAVSVMKQDWSLSKRINVNEFIALNPFIAKMDRDAVVHTGEASIMLQGLVDHLVNSILDDCKVVT